MAPAFRMRLGGRVGSGRQWMSWIHLDDAAALVLFAIENESVHARLSLFPRSSCAQCSANFHANCSAANESSRAGPPGPDFVFNSPDSTPRLKIFLNRNTQERQIHGSRNLDLSNVRRTGQPRCHAM
jgi:hypothetical protein